MCGIVGQASWRPDADHERRVRAMALALRHRGPDGDGLWTDPGQGVALGHRRLAIIDLSPQGAQPMRCASGRRVISYNGEIYNFAELRAELERCGRAPRWRGRSDTEVLLAAVDAWGIRGALERLVGMFAFALWDRDERSLTLARDRFGEKPLYYGEIGGRVIFASELKAVRQVEPRLQIDRDALAAYLQFGYVPSPRCIYEGLHKLEPGHLVTFFSPGRCTGPQPYWTLTPADPDRRAQSLPALDDDHLLHQLQTRLETAVSGQMVADVSLGAFLSGGIDSSLVVALMQANSARQVQTFTIGFRESRFDEAPHARAVARHLGTAHTETYFSAADALALVPELPAVYDEPFADSSQLPTLLVSRMTRKRVTVALSGDGGDELFAGYPRYPLTAATWRRISRLPAALRRGAASVLALPSAGTWDRLLQQLARRGDHSVAGRRLHTLARLLPAATLGDMYTRLMSRWPPGGIPLQPAPEPAAMDWPAARHDVDAMRLWDLRCYLPDDLLVKVDRAAMNTSLETRAPFLDHRVAELALALPHRLLLRDGKGKWCLRQLLGRHLPAALFERPKSGFEVPLADWLRGPLRDWAASLLSPRRLAQQQLLEGGSIATAWQQHLAGHSDRSLQLWGVLMFQAWSRAIEVPAIARAETDESDPLPAQPLAACHNLESGS